MPHGLSRALFAVLVSTLLFACGSSSAGDDTPGDDTTADGAVDDGARPDARVDAGPPGTADAAVDVCGDGVRGTTEACDDDDTDSGDGCSADCLTIETGYRCPNPGQACVANRCGDRRIDSPETCEDGDAAGGDGCSATCTLEPGWQCPLLGAACSAAMCGDGIIAGREQCDDGDATGNDGCSATCTLEPGWKCPTAGADCTRTRCGDGIPEGTEQCDNDVVASGLPRSFDGCDSYCTLEPACNNGVCSIVCGDGLILPIPGQEACDDGNLRDGDGCDHACAIEPGYTCSPRPTPPPASIPIPVIIRDFKGQDRSGGHADFEANASNPNIRFGLVTDALTAGRPTFNTGHTRDASKGDPTSSTFVQWFATNSFVKTLTREVSLTRVGTTSTYTFDSTNRGFFPIDNVGWTDPALPAADREPLRATDGTVNLPGNHNFNFTTEAHFWFQYDGSEVLTFSGDDDLWVYVNGKLCLDVGGLHSRRTATMDLADPSRSEVRDSGGAIDNAQSVTQRTVVQACKTALDARRAQLGHSPLFEVSIFHAERHTNASNFRLTLTNFIKNSSSCESLCGDGIVSSDEVCDLGPGMNDGGYNGCLDCRRLGPYCGDTITTNPPETCDDGVNAGGYGLCGPACTIDGFCGDGIRQPAHEDCDDGPMNGQRFCSAECRSGVD